MLEIVLMLIAAYCALNYAGIMCACLLFTSQVSRLTLRYRCLVLFFGLLLNEQPTPVPHAPSAHGTWSGRGIIRMHTPSYIYEHSFFLVPGTEWNVANSKVRPCFPLFSITKALSKVLCLILHAFYRMPLSSSSFVP